MTTSETIASPIQERLTSLIRREVQKDSGEVRVVKLLGDASTRQYFRWQASPGQSYVLAAYPETFDPDHFGYLQICGLLQEIGVPVPRVLAVDGSLGIVLQEDLGDLSLQRLLLTAPAEERKRRFCEAIDLIIRIQRDGGPRVGAEWEASRLSFDREKLLWEFHFFVRHFLGDYRKRELPYRDALEAEFERIAEELAAAPRFLCHRDMHVRNLMIHQDQLHVIDFQDARWGPASYDLSSLLKDSIELDQDEVESLVEFYLDESQLPETPERFRRQFHLAVVQRMLKALGTYGYQIAVRGISIYKQYVTGTLRRALLSLDQLTPLPAIRRLVEREIQQIED